MLHSTNISLSDLEYIVGVSAEAIVLPIREIVSDKTKTGRDCESAGCNERTPTQLYTLARFLSQNDL